MIRHRDSFPARLAVLVCVTCVGGAASAAPPEDLLVWPRGPATATDGVDAALREAGVRSRDFKPVRARLVAEREAEAEATRVALGAVEAGLGAARVAFLEQRIDAMIAALTEAEAAAVAALPAGPLCGATLWEIEFQLGLAYLTRKQDGDELRARERFALALALDGERRPAAGLYGPDLGLAFLQAVDEVARRPARPLLVSATPVDAGVAVDCRSLAPQLGVRSGLHVLRVEAPGRRAQARVFTRGDEQGLEVGLEAEVGAALGGWWGRGALDPGSASARQAVHAYTGAARVVWLEEDEGRHVARLVVDGRVRRVARASGAGEAVAQALAVDPPREGPRPDRPGKRRRTGLWVGLAGAALGSVALGLGLGLGLREPDARLQLVVR